MRTVFVHIYHAWKDPGMSLGEDMLQALLHKTLKTKCACIRHSHSPHSFRPRTFSKISVNHSNDKDIMHTRH